MFEFLSDPTFQFVIIVALAILAIVGPIIVYLKQRVRKSVTYRIVSRNALFSVKEEMKKELEITYKGKKIEDAQLVLIEVSNTGDVPIEEKDYKNPISFDFGEKAQILMAEVTKTDPKDLHASVNIDRNFVILTPLLTNAGDSLTLKIMVSGLGEVIKTSSRIVGVKQLKEATPTMDISTGLIALSMVLSYSCLFAFMYTIMSNPTLGLMFLIGFVCFFASTLSMLIWVFMRHVRDGFRRKKSSE
jgi:hypothetical protein